jgi:hypothetical protein
MRKHAQKDDNELVDELRNERRTDARFSGLR